MKNLNMNMNALNIFTDASVSGNYSAPGFILYDGYNPKCSFVKCLYNSTNNEGEAYAIKMAISYVATFGKHYNAINIFSDSMITVKGLREWIRNWIKNIEDGTMYSSSGDEVANQAILLDCIKMIVYYELPIRFYHIDGHKDCNKLKDITKYISDFRRDNNGININMQLATFLMSNNTKIDELTRSYLVDGKETAIDCKTDTLFQSMFPYNIDFEKYFKLIGEE